jgi:hypothetical protein
MSPLRIAGLIMISAALMFGAVDIYRDAIHSGSQISVLSIWAMFSMKCMTWVQMFIQNYIWAPIWSNGIGPILLLPAWIFFGIAGLLVFFLGRRKIE